MKGNIYSRQKCPVCGSTLNHDEKRRGCYCKNHPQVGATGLFFVRFGRAIFKNFRDYQSAERFLIGLRYKTDEGSYDYRDYKRDNPLGFNNLAQKWCRQKERSGIKAKTLQSYRNFMSKAEAVWGNLNIKDITGSEIEDFLFSDLRSPTGNPISDKTRSNMRSCFHDFWSWVVRREPMVQMPVFPDIRFELGYRNIVSIEDQTRILEEVLRISEDINRKIWFGIKLLATYINIRPGELRDIKEGHILLDAGMLIIPHPKEGKPKYAHLDTDDIEVFRSFPKGIPDMYFFRHKGMAGQQFGPKYFKTWWDRACGNLGIYGVDLYGGTKHSTTVELGKYLSPEQIKRGGTGHQTNKAFERYLIPHKTETLLVRNKIKELQKGTAQVIDLKNKKPTSE